MENTTRQYNVLIFPCSETGNTPSSAIHMEVAGDFKMFYEDALKWIRAFHECQTADDRFGGDGDGGGDVFKINRTNLKWIKMLQWKISG